MCELHAPQAVRLRKTNFALRVTSQRRSAYASLTLRHSRVFKSLRSRDNIGIIHHIEEFVKPFFEFFLDFFKFLLFDNLQQNSGRSFVHNYSCRGDKKQLFCSARKKFCFFEKNHSKLLK